MSTKVISTTVKAIAIATFAMLISTLANANSYREKGKAVMVAGSALEVTPQQDWNELSVKVGKNTETWTLDGEQLNDITFFAGIEPGKPLVRERSKKHEPLPKVGKNMLLVDIPELLEGTYRAHKQIGIFKLTSTEPGTFLEKDGVRFTYEYADADKLTRMGEARAAVVDGKLYMITFDAPRLHYFTQGIAAYRALVETAALR